MTTNMKEDHASHVPALMVSTNGLEDGAADGVVSVAVVGEDAEHHVSNVGLPGAVVNW